MSNENKLIVPQEFARREVVQADPMAMVAHAVQSGMDPATIKALMDLAERHEASEARKAFNQAFNAFKSEAIKIVRSTDVKDGPLKGKKYADKFAIVSAVTSYLSKHGLSASWRLTRDEKDWMEVTCTLRHVLGHAEQVSMGGPPDTGPGRNSIQARASTNTYLEKITLKAICGLAEQGEDDDGRQGKGAAMQESALADWLAKIEELQSLEDATALWQSISQATTQARDVEAHETLRAALLAKRKTFKEAQK